jgi:hypothetical protein
MGRATMKTVKLTTDQGGRLMLLAARLGVNLINYNGQLALREKGGGRCYVVYTSYQRPGRRFEWDSRDWRPAAVAMATILRN